MTMPSTRRSLSAATLLAVAVGFTGPVAVASSAKAAAPAAPPPQPPSAARAIAAADAIAEKGLGALKLSAGESYERAGEQKGSKGLHYVTYDLTYKGLKVVGANAVVVSDESGAVLDTTAATSPAVTVASTNPKLPAAKAVTAAKAGFSKVDDAHFQRLVIHQGTAGHKLAWEIHVEGVRAGKPSNQDVYVDAMTGAVLDRVEYVKLADATGKSHHNGDVTFTTTQSGTSYQTKSTAAPGLTCTNQSQTVYTDADNVWGNGSGTDMPTACVDLMFAGEQENFMLKEWTGRNGVNGSGSFYQGRVGMTDVNAYWTGSYATFGKNQAGTKQLTNIDVVAHEYGHGIFQFSGGAADGEGEQGGMNESTGDILGAATECYAAAKFPGTPDKCDYEVGEMVNLTGSGPIRYMYDPSKISDPNCATQVTSSTEVHKAAGPQNHWFYLLAEGSSPTNGQPKSPICSGGPSVVKGIGIQKATNIFMAGLQRKTSSWSHKAARVATLNASKTLYPNGCTEFDAVKDAWLGVGVPAQSGEPTRPTSCDGGGQTNDYSMTVSPSSGSVQAGSSTSATVNTTVTSGQGQSVTLSASGLPSGVTASFNPATVTTGGSSTMTLTASSSAPSGTYTVTVLASGTVTKSATYQLTVGSTTPPGGSTPPDVDVAKVQAHLTQLQSIASSNGGNRRAGSGGYTASVDYVVGKLQAAGYTVTKQRCTTCTYASDNIIAEWPGGDASKVYMFGAHLDSVSAGPGINDNGSGSAGILEVALTLAEKKPTMLNKVRFAWWTDEEQGLNGSKYYVNNLGTGKSAIKAYYNFDMIASKNAGYFINNMSSTQSGPMKAYWDSLNLQPEENTEGVGRSDDYPFTQAGIPASGYAMGASNRMTSTQASKWGGTSGAAFDSCYHQACDTTSNINATALNRAVDGIAYTLWKQAVGQDPQETNDFSMSVTPPSASVDPGASASATVNTSITSGVAQSVSLSASGAPAGTTVSFNPTSVKSGGSSAMTVQTSSTTPAGTYTITVTGTGSVTRSATFTLTVGGGGEEQNDFSLSANPSSATVDAGASTTATVSTQLTSGLAQSVSLSASGAPAGTTVSFNPTSVKTGASSTMTVNTSSTTPAGTYTITVTGSGSVSRSTTFTLTVKSTGGGTGPGWTGLSSTQYRLPDNTTVDSPINVDYNYSVSSATIRYDVAHTCLQDLSVSLVAPDGTAVPVRSSSPTGTDCTRQDGILEQTVSFPAEAANGTWKLRIRDNYTNDTGTLYAWRLTFPAG